ncbi:NAC domain-containing protein 90-like [Mangifera indica]|uniref:NAC domain-containing protein 90-like n=1 Tax=Mangifera indica TaxID=29780 RepID=UPI001CFA7222|nr:NAC domain-containing protein 90-like [Mangifera indica]
MVEDMPPGFRFYPTEVELISFYLHHKLHANSEDFSRIMDQVIPVVNIYDFNPWELPQFSQYLCHKDPEQWFFFVPRQESEVRGGRPNRLTTEGYWNATGSHGFVYSSNRIVGGKRTMVFYRGRAPNGRKTQWKMNEYNAIEREASTYARQHFSLCRVYKKTKCLRDFDRRPAPPLPPLQLEAIMGQSRAQQVEDHIGDEATTSQHHHQPSSQICTVESTNSVECSSSVDHGHTSQNDESNNMAVGSDCDHLLWDLDQLDLFCGMR